MELWLCVPGGLSSLSFQNELPALTVGGSCGGRGAPYLSECQHVCHYCPDAGSGALLF